MKFDHILLVGFGAPTEASQVESFLKIVTQGRNIPKERIEAVSSHYRRVGGRSPYNDEVFRFQQNLERELKAAGVHVPVLVGMRNWDPFLKDTLRSIHESKLQKGLGLILAPFRSESSCKRYKDNVDEALRKSHAGSVNYDYLGPWFDHSLFVSAYVKQITNKLDEIKIDANDVKVLFTAHSIPLEMNESCSECEYEVEFETACRNIADKLKLPHWECLYQSRSGNTREPWLGPDVMEWVHSSGAVEKKNVLFVPIGFFCENVEVLYDLDVEIQECLQKRNTQYFRVKPVTHETDFLQMFVRLIQAKL